MFSGLFDKLILRRNDEGKMERYNRTNILVRIYETSYHIVHYPQKLVSSFSCYLLRLVNIFSYPIMICFTNDYTFIIKFIN